VRSLTSKLLPPASGAAVLDTTTFIMIAAALNAALYHLPLFYFAWRNLDLSTFTGALTLATLGIALLLETGVLLILLALISQRLLKVLCCALALGNAVALYFLTTYHVVLDATMMGNVLNTNFAEAAEFLHPMLLGYLLVVGVLPCWLVARVRIRRSSRSRLALAVLACLSLAAIAAYLSGPAWPWIDQNSKRVGGLILPWSYLINGARHVLSRVLTSETQVPLPPATFASSEKTVVILVIGEAARARNFALYGYPRPTNPLLSRAGVIPLRNASACATYTNAAIRCILSNLGSGSAFSRPYEPLPSYLQRSGVDVIWRSHNFGEPPIKVQSYQRAGDLAPSCTGPHCAYDEVLLAGLEPRIRASPRRNVLVVLHQSGSHGPAYYTKYPPEFERFTPVCKSVELSRCTPQQLLNAYDNTIVYEDYFLSQTIGVLKKLQNTRALLIYISDHGESLGEHGWYLHGVPYSIAPEEQKKVPFILWMSAEFSRSNAVPAARLAAQPAHSQRDVFHTIMGAFSMRSDAYQPEFDVLSGAFVGP